ncbi:hypothetical protein K2Y11_24020 [bacterium]|nr:hypothetical protein [bacterium]
MSRPTACHVLHYTSSVDDTDQPYIVAAPEPIDGAVACIVLLHDTLNPAHRDSFIEGALKEVSRWQEALRNSSQPFILLLPMGRGNAGWLGVGGRDLFDVLARAEAEFPIDPNRIYLAGAGAGGTGALQVACWFPDRWNAIAVAGPAIDDHDDLPLGAKDFPAWEQSARQAHRASLLLSNIGSTPILVDHPWWMDGLSGTTHPEHHRRLSSLLDRHAANAEVHHDRPLLPGGEAWPRDPKSLAEWFFSRPVGPSLNGRSHTSFSPRSFSGTVRVERLAQPGKPSVVKAMTTEKSLVIQTKGVADLAVHAIEMESVRLDRQKFASHVIEPMLDRQGWIRFQQIGESWHAVSTKKTKKDDALPIPVKSPQLPGPINDMRWDRVAFVVGTMGDDYETRTAERLAESIKLKWTDGSDSASFHPGDRTSLVQYDVLADAEVTDELMQSRHLVVIGTPRTNMLLARFQSRIGVEWTTSEEVEEGIDSFRIGGKTYKDRQEGLFLLTANPEAPTHYLLVVTGTTPEALASAARFRTNYLPDYVVYRGSDVRQWGFCGADWRPL